MVHLYSSVGLVYMFYAKTAPENFDSFAYFVIIAD